MEYDKGTKGFYILKIVTINQNMTKGYTDAIFKGVPNVMTHWRTISR